MFVLYDCHKIQSEWSEPHYSGYKYTSFKLRSIDIAQDRSTKKLKSWFLADTDMEEQTEDAFDEPMQRVN